MTMQKNPLENWLSHCRMSNPVATRTVHRWALDLIICISQPIDGGLAHVTPIGGTSNVNHRSIEVDNLVTKGGTRLLLGPTEVSRRRKIQTVHFQSDTNPAPIHIANPLHSANLRPIISQSHNPNSTLQYPPIQTNVNRGTDPALNLGTSLL